ncbi:hypothetical protein GmHk_09G026867 [Glycine max]|nr:hypothetical protein GmHk_09G026867 [Glycine max]
MAKSYKNLQAKLQELQSILDQALLLGPETQSPDSFSNDIKHKLAFIGNLLAAQVSSHHPSKPHHLHHISERLFTMESYGEYSGAVAEATGYVDEEKQTEEMKNGFDKLESFDYEDADDFLEDFAGDKGLVEFEGALLRKPEGKKENYLETEESRHSTFGERCSALAAGDLSLA